MSKKEDGFGHAHTYEQRLLLSIERLLRDILAELKAQRPTTKNQEKLLLEE